MADSHGTLCDEHLVRRLLAELEGGRSFVISTLLSTKGSMPRHAGARMILLEDGTFLGTVGGGSIELMAQQRSRDILAGTEHDQIEWMTHAKTGMACGGDALIALRLVTPAQKDFFADRLLSLIDSKKPFIVTEQWADPAHVIVEALPVEELSQNDPRALSDMPVWDEATATYTEPLGPDPVAYIFGGGHVGRALTPVLAGVGFRVVVFDDREGVAVKEDFPAAEAVFCGDFKNISEHVQVTRRDYAVVTTHGHAFDIDVLEQLYPCKPAYVGCIGSMRKSAFARKTLEERGISKEWTDAIYMPIGDDIMAVTPSEIAISIAAEMIRCRANSRPEKPHQKRPSST